MISLRTLFALSLAAGLPAAVIDGNYTPGAFTYPGSFGAFGAGPTTAIGQQFTVTGGAWDNIGIHLPLSLTSGINLVNIQLVDDAGGLPGSTVLASFSLAISGFQTDLSPVGLILNPGTYWLTVGAGAGDTQVRWFVNDTGVTSGTSPTAIYNNGSWINLPGGFTAAAYQITGDSLATVSPTPEPGTFLVGLAAVGALALRRRSVQ